MERVEIIVIIEGNNNNDNFHFGNGEQTDSGWITNLRTSCNYLKHTSLCVAW